VDGVTSSVAAATTTTTAAAFNSEQSISSGGNLTNNNSQITTSVSSSDLFKKPADDGAGIFGGGGKSLVKNVAAWNPFEDEEGAPFSQLTEDHIFGAEFDKIRQEGSQTSEWLKANERESKTKETIWLSTGISAITPPENPANPLIIPGPTESVLIPTDEDPFGAAPFSLKQKNSKKSGGKA
jgi:hypothetical protein